MDEVTAELPISDSAPCARAEAVLSPHPIAPLGFPAVRHLSEVKLLDANHQIFEISVKSYHGTR
jgi:hypothetical protein